MMPTESEIRALPSWRYWTSVSGPGKTQPEMVLSVGEEVVKIAPKNHQEFRGDSHHSLVMEIHSETGEIIPQHLLGGRTPGDVSDLYIPKVDLDSLEDWDQAIAICHLEMLNQQLMRQAIPIYEYKTDKTVLECMFVEVRTRIFENKFVDILSESPMILLRFRPGQFLASCRYKLNSRNLGLVKGIYELAENSGCLKHLIPLKGWGKRNSMKISKFLDTLLLSIEGFCLGKAEDEFFYRERDGLDGKELSRLVGSVIEWLEMIGQEGRVPELGRVERMLDDWPERIQACGYALSMWRELGIQPSTKLIQNIVKGGT